MAALILKVLYMVAFVSGTIDINIHQLQFISDHLDPAECRKLSELLHHTEYAVKTPISGENEPEKPCIFLLLKWDRTEGRKKTFDHLALRLRQLGRKGLSDFLSKSVLGEDDRKLKEKFLSNPFHKHIPRESELLETNPSRKKKEKKTKKKVNKKAKDGLEAWEIACIVSGSLLTFSFLCYFIYKFFGTGIKRLFRNIAPDVMVEWCDLVTGQCKWCCKKVKKNYDQNLIGKRRSRILTPEERKSVVVLNRNLNNYMNCELEAASYLSLEV